VFSPIDREISVEDDGLMAAGFCIIKKLNFSFELFLTCRQKFVMTVVGFREVFEVGKWLVMLDYQ
jgi:hypothetical protein